MVVLNKRDVYEKCMMASLENAEMWINEARMILETCSRSHAHVLTLFAVEEIGKAIMCWLTINKVYPFNHQEVDFRSKKGVFRNHSLKGGAALGFLFGMTKSMRKAKGKDAAVFVKHPVSGEDVELEDLIPDGAKIMAQSRELLMYVDIKKGPNGLEVSNPLHHNPPVEIAIEDALIALASLRTFIKNSSRYIEYFREVRKIVEENILFPKNPEWEATV